MRPSLRAVALNLVLLGSLLPGGVSTCTNTIDSGVVTGDVVGPPVTITGCGTSKRAVAASCSVERHLISHAHLPRR